MLISESFYHPHLGTHVYRVATTWNIPCDHLSQSAWAAVRKYHVLGGLNSIFLFLSALQAGEFKIKVLTHPVSNENPLLGSQMVAFLLHPHTAESGSHKLPLVSSYKSTNPNRRTPPSWSHCLSQAPFPNGMASRVWESACEFGEDTNTQAVTARRRDKAVAGVAWRVCLENSMPQNRMASSSARISTLACCHLIRKLRSTALPWAWKGENQNICCMNDTYMEPFLFK